MPMLLDEYVDGADAIWFWKQYFESNSITEGSSWITLHQMLSWTIYFDPCRRVESAPRRRAKLNIGASLRHNLDQEGNSIMNLVASSTSLASRTFIDPHLNDQVTQRIYWCCLCSKDFTSCRCNGRARLFDHPQTSRPWERSSWGTCNICRSLRTDTESFDMWPTH